MRFAALGVLIAFVGCGSSDVDVRGQVSYQGKPVRTGAVLLEDPSGVAPPGYGVIESGAYRLTTTPGEKVVRITATEETGKMLEGGMGKVPETIDLLPAKYNTESGLRRTIEKRRNQTIDFALE